MALTDKQEQFCQEYLIDLNATQAAIRAGYSEKCAKEQGCENLTKPNIQDRIAELQAERSERVLVTQDQVVRELAKIAFGDIGRLFDSSGALLPLDEMEPNDRASISSIKTYEEKASIGEETITQGVIRELKQWDKLKALEMLGRHLGTFEKDNKQKTASGFSVVIDGSNTNKDN